MSGLSLVMLCSISAPICNIFNRRIKSIIKTNCVEELSLLYYILSQTVVPDDAFKWLAESMRSSVNIISCLIKQRLWLDRKMASIVKLLEKSEYEFLSCAQIDKMLEGEIHLTSYEKHYVFT